MTRTEALSMGDRFYFSGTPCKYGHLNFRYVKGSRCVDCARRINSLVSPEAKTRYRHNNWIRNKEKWRKWGREFHNTMRQKALVHLGGKCVHCGESDGRVLQLDHVKGGGLTDIRKNKKHGWAKYKQAARSRTKYQLLCANCNWIKRYTHNECGAKLNPEGRLAKLRNRVFDLLGHECSFCGKKDKRFLQLDHKNGGGKEEHRLIGAQGVCYKALKEPDFFQILCANCNWIKRHTNKEVHSYANTA